MSRPKQVVISLRSPLQTLREEYLRLGFEPNVSFFEEIVRFVLDYVQTESNLSVMNDVTLVHETHQCINRYLETHPVNFLIEETKASHVIAFAELIRLYYHSGFWANQPDGRYLVSNYEANGMTSFIRI